MEGRGLPRAPRTDPYEPNSGIRLVWGFLCQGCVTPFWSSFAFRFFCSTRAASILPSRPPYLHRRRAQRRSRTALLQRRRRLILDGREHGGRLLAIGWLARAMIRGEPAIGRDQSREPRLYSVEPVWVQTMKQSYASAGKAPRRRVHSLSGIAAIAECGLPPPRIVIGYPRRIK